jgi:hypothetical protein
VCRTYVSKGRCDHWVNEYECKDGDEDLQHLGHQPTSG